MSPSRRTAVVSRMRLWQRILLSIAGVAAFVIGGLAVFVSENDLGSTALVLIGAALVTAAVVGLIPMRVSVRDVDLVLGDFVDSLVEAAGPSAAQQVLRDADRVLPRDTAKMARARAREAFEYEQAVLGALGRVTSGWAGVHGQARQEAGRIIDAVIETPAGRLNIEIRKFSGGSKNTTNRVLEVMARTYTAPGRWLLVADAEMSRAATDLLARAGVEHVVWRDESDDKALESAVRRAISSDRRSGS